MFPPSFLPWLSCLFAWMRHRVNLGLDRFSPDPLNFYADRHTHQTSVDPTTVPHYISSAPKGQPRKQRSTLSHTRTLSLRHGIELSSSRSSQGSKNHSEKVQHSLDLSFFQLFLRSDSLFLTKIRCFFDDDCFRYQLDLCKRAVKQNTIVYLGTGCGKTHIAVLLMYELGHLIRKPSSSVCVFLAPTVPLVRQVRFFFWEIRGNFAVFVS